MLSRLTTVTATLRYKFANGYILKEDSKIAPYIYLGGGFDNLSNAFWKEKDRVNTGSMASNNGGAGVKYNFNQKYNITYNMGFGYFSSDNSDFRVEGMNDAYLQHSVLFGINF
jgi:OmpA-OmpF porin, OOP family